MQQAALQVVHHPTVLAAYGEGRKWTFEGDAEVKSKFWGRSIELTPVGVLKLTLHDGEVFTWSKVCTPHPWLLSQDPLQSAQGTLSRAAFRMTL